MEEAAKRHGIARLGLTRALLLHRILAGLGQGAGIGAGHHLGTRRAQGLREPGRRGLGIDPHAAALEGFEGGRQRLPRFDGHGVAEMRAHLGVDLGGHHEQSGCRIRARDQEAEGDRREGHVGAANVEQPVDRGRIGDDRRILARLLEDGGDVAALVGSTAAREGQRVDEGGCRRRGRLVRPYRVDGIGAQRDEDQQGRAFRQPIDHVLADQKRIVADPRAGRCHGLQPSGRRLIGDMQELPKRIVDFAPHLQHVAAIGEDRGALGQHDGEAGTSREPGQPGQPFRGGRHILAEMLVRPGHEKAVDAQTGEAGPER